MRRITKITIIPLVLAILLAICMALPNAISVWSLNSKVSDLLESTKPTDFAQIRTIDIYDWRAEAKVCPYSVANFSLSKIAGIPGTYRETLSAEDENGILFRRLDGQTTLVVFSRLKLDLCST